MKILAIETSCDETSMAVIDQNKNILSHVTNTQIDTFKHYGGVIPELSSRLHEQNLFYVYNETLQKANTTIDEISYIAVTYGPGLIGSLLCGINFAKSLALIHNKKIIPVNHMQAHISSIFIENEVSYPFLSLIVSGGHTEIVLVKKIDDCEIIGQTLDDACGECFDKVARLLDLGYPGGPKIDKLSKEGTDVYDLPTPLDDNSYNFSYSGLKSACYNKVNSLKMKNIEINKADFACSFTHRAIDILIKKLLKAQKQYDIDTVCVVGGVSANSYLKEQIERNFAKFYIPSLEYCTDNGAMIAMHALLSTNKAVLYNNIDANVNLTVEDNWTN